MPPLNDNLNNAELLFGTASSVGPVSIDSASTEGGEIGSVEQTIWYYFLAASTTTGVYFSTLGSAAGDAGSGDGITPPNPFGSLDTKINVYEQTTPTPTFGTLFGHNIASNDDAPSGGGAFWSEVTFNVTAGKYYFIQVGTVSPGYTGTVILNYSGIPPVAGPTTVQFISSATSSLYVPAGSGGNVPILMPPTVQAGDYLVAQMANFDVAVINPTISPSGWTNYSGNGYFWVKVATGGEAGTTVNWTYQDTSASLPGTLGNQRVLLGIVLCYRLSAPPTLIDTITVGIGSTSGSSATKQPYGGVLTDAELRIYGGIGARSDGPGDQQPVYGFSWTNVRDRAGLIGLPWGGSDPLGVNDATSFVAGDTLYDTPTSGVYDPGDGLTFYGGSDSTGLQIQNIRFHFPAIAVALPYWGVLIG